MAVGHDECEMKSPLCRRDLSLAGALSVRPTVTPIAVDERDWAIGVPFGRVLGCFP
jgi:hypothetical protein